MLNVYNNVVVLRCRVRCATQTKAQTEPRPMVWLRSVGKESVPPGQTSTINVEQVTMACGAAAQLRAKHPKATICILSFYKGQLNELLKTVPASLDVDVLTVDACQGSEFDYVVLSTVRCNQRNSLGFVADPQRLCVAISRSKAQLMIVGCDRTLGCNDQWRQVVAACQVDLRLANEAKLGVVDSNPNGLSLFEKKRADAAAEAVCY